MEMIIFVMQNFEQLSQPKSRRRLLKGAITGAAGVTGLA
jgi:hypothetical protein